MKLEIQSKDGSYLTVCQSELDRDWLWVISLP